MTRPRSLIASGVPAQANTRWRTPEDVTNGSSCILLRSRAVTRKKPNRLATAAVVRPEVWLSDTCSTRRPSVRLVVTMMASWADVTNASLATGSPADSRHAASTVRMARTNRSWTSWKWASENIRRYRLARRATGTVTARAAIASPSIDHVIASVRTMRQLRCGRDSRGSPGAEQLERREHEHRGGGADRS